jgi:hypothetical protein
MTNLQHAFHVPSIYPPWVKGQISLDRWNTPCLHYIDPTPPYLIPEHCRDLLYPETGTLHIIIASAPNDPTVAVHHSSPTTQGTARGLTQTQALCQAVKEALTAALPHHRHDITLWISHKSVLHKLTTLSPHSVLPPRQAAKLSHCGCDPSWFCSPHDACFIHESCLYEGSSRWPPVKPVRSSWVSMSREWLADLLSHRSSSLPSS